jgi:hypothetical protein
MVVLCQGKDTFLPGEAMENQKQKKIAPKIDGLWL